MDRGRRTKVWTRFLVIALLSACSHAAELQANTAAAFDRYIRATEAQHAEDLRDGRFLVIDALPDAVRQGAYAELRRGQIYIEELQARESGSSIPIPDGRLHHWVGVIYIPGVTLSQVLAVLQDYDNHQTVYKPDVRRSKLLERRGNDLKIFLQFYQKSIVTVVLNANFDVHYAMAGPTRAVSRSYSTRIAEVQDPGTPKEHELPVDDGHGYLWRLDNYSRVEEKDGGAYVQIESVGLSRTVPFILAWLINPLLKSIPRNALSKLLSATRTAVVNSKHPAGQHGS